MVGFEDLGLTVSLGFFGLGFGIILLVDTLKNRKQNKKNCYAV